MKKVLSFLVAGALALGLIGCSGDMHNDVDPATIPASIALASAPRLSASPLKNLILFFSKDKNQIEKFPLSDFFPDYNLL